MILNPGFVLVTTAVYSLVGAVVYLQNVLLPCRSISSDLPFLLMLLLGPLAYLISTGVIATASSERWVPRTVANTAAGLVAGTLVAHLLYAGLDRYGPECGAMFLCTWCSPTTPLKESLEALVPALVGTVMAPVVGWIARCVG